MQFNTYEFAVFFLIVYSLYVCFNHRWQNIVLLAASYVFYAWWNWRFLPLLIVSTLIAFVIGIKIDESDNQRTRKLYLIAGLGVNVSVLGFFKYFNFFADNLQAIVHLLGFSMHTGVLKIVLPVGISFYTFQKMSYLIDIYRREIKPTKNLLDFALFAAFFPQLVAGPIERAGTLLPQIIQKRILSSEKFVEGCYLILWGLFKKVFIADNCARIVDNIFMSSAKASGGEVLIAAYAFAFQIYGDFSGYTDMARGLAKLMGIDLVLNFNLPYFSKNPSEFWRKWHISLSNWLRDYLYIPLGGNRKGSVLTYRNLMITMAVAGLWHGAAWTFIAWGLYMGLLLVLHRLMSPYLNKVQESVGANAFWSALSIALTFHLVCVGWILFRAQSIGQAGVMLRSLFLHFNMTPDALEYAKQVAGFVWPLILVQFIQFMKNDLSFYFRMPAPGKATFLAVLLYLLVIYGTSTEAFIYFQF